MSQLESFTLIFYILSIPLAWYIYKQKRSISILEKKWWLPILVSIVSFIVGYFLIPFDSISDTLLSVSFWFFMIGFMLLQFVLLTLFFYFLLTKQWVRALIMGVYNCINWYMGTILILTISLTSLARSCEEEAREEARINEEKGVALDQNRDTIYHIENTLNEGGEIIKQDTIWH